MCAQEENMKKKLLVIVAIMAMLIAVFAITASAAEPSYKDGEWIYAADGTTKLAIRDTDGNPLIWYMNGEELKYVRADQTDTTQSVYVVYKIEAGGNGFDTSILNPQKNLKDIDIYDNGTQIECSGINSALVLFNMEKLDIDALNGWLWGNKNGCCTKMRGIVFPSTLKGIGQEGLTNTKLVQAWNLENTQLFYLNSCSPFSTSTFTQEATGGVFITPYVDAAPISVQGSGVKVYIMSPVSTFNTCQKWYQLFRGCNKLEKVYAPEIMSQGYGEEAFRDNSSKYIVFYTGDEQGAIDMRTNTQEYHNGSLRGATIISYETYLADPTTYDNSTSTIYIVHSTNYCDAFYASTHLGDDHDCTTENYCERCKETFAKQADTHSIVENLAYANGFDKAGIYNCYCDRKGCTMAGKEVRDGEEDPIIISKGYSTPENINVKGLNAGFEIKKALLDRYNDLNNDASFTLFMVNPQIDGQTISKILNGETLELESGVKGVNVKISSVSYTSLSVEVRGFDDSTKEGNFYTLNLITAIAVKTDDGVHYVQAKLQNSANTTVEIDGVEFNIVTANKVYNPTAQS